jgi:hypothetical protein
MFRVLVALCGATCLLLTFIGHQPIQAPASVAAVHLGPAPNAVVVPAPKPSSDAGVLAADDFSRPADEAWPAALKGGGYSFLGPTTDYSVEQGTGTMRTPSAVDRGAMLTGLRARDVDVTVRVSTDRNPQGGDQFVYVDLRATDELTRYRARVRLDPDRNAWLQFARTIGSSTELLGTEIRAPSGADATAGSLWIRAATTGQDPAALGLKAWQDGQPEPDTWLYTVTDADQHLAAPGSVGIETYVSARATNAPVTFRFSDLRIAAAAPDLVNTGPIVKPTPAPIIVIKPTPLPVTASDVWQSLAPRLDSAWGSDTPATVALLEPFVAQFPDDPTGREKLYAALIATARDARAQGDMARAATTLERAREVLPTRGEAVIELASLAPTPAPIVQEAPPEPVPAEDEAPSSRPPAPAPVQIPAAVAAPRVPVTPRQPVNAPAPAPVLRAAPTPTKVPFTVPPPGP